jgi:Leucine-rich repeat (LRR) protein
MLLIIISFPAIFRVLSSYKESYFRNFTKLRYSFPPILILSKQITYWDLIIPIIFLISLKRGTLKILLSSNIDDTEIIILLMLHMHTSASRNIYSDVLKLQESIAIV